MNQAKMKKNKILIVDDDQLNSKALAQRLERRGFSIQLLEEPSRVLDILKQEVFDLVMLDIVMPGVDGLSLLKQIRNTFTAEQLPVIMVTAVNDSIDISDAFEWGANDYITKPVNIDAAVARVKGQLNVADLQQMNIKLQEAQAVAALVITYHHEINNPLAVLKSSFQSLVSEHEELNGPGVERIFQALDRIKGTLQTIKEFAEKNDIDFEPYAQTSKMLRIKK